MMDDTVTLRISEDARLSLAAAHRSWPDLPRRVFEACCQAAVDVVWKRYPRALWMPDYEPFCQHCERVLAKLLTVLGADKVDDTDVAARQSLLAAAALIAYDYAYILPYEEPLRELHVPADLDKETLLDTVAVCCMNAHGGPFSPTFSDTLAEILRKLLGPSADGPGLLSDDEVQHVLQTAFLSSGGPTPGLVRLIVKEVEAAKKQHRKPKLPKEAEIPLSMTPDEVKSLYDQMADRFKEEIALDLLADMLVERSTCKDLVEGLHGQWRSLLGLIAPHVWPPDVSTAHKLLTPARRDTWVGDTVLAAKRVKERFAKRAQRERKRFPVELDKPIEANEGVVSLHELMPDKSASVEMGESLEDVLNAYAFTQREQQVAILDMLEYKQKEIASFLKISPQRVSQLVEQIKTKARSRAHGKLKP